MQPVTSYEKITAHKIGLDTDARFGIAPESVEHLTPLEQIGLGDVLGELAVVVENGRLENGHVLLTSYARQLLERGLVRYAAVHDVDFRVD